MEFKINQQEKGALCGLPHLLQLLYVMGIRPYMDYQTGVVGIARGISYQSLREELYVEPRPGCRGGSPSKHQIQRALMGLERAGVINLCSQNKKLIIQCLLATKDDFAQNKAAAGAIPLTATKYSAQAAIKTSHLEQKDKKAAATDLSKAATPPVSGYTPLSLAAQPVKIPGDFQPSVTVIEKAKRQNCPTASCSDELTKFICHHQSKGTERCDWDAEFLRWLLRAKQYHQERRYDRHQNTNKKHNASAVERVVAAYQDAFVERRDYIEHNEQGYCLVVGEHD